jgi:hypothetical protein
MLTAAAVLTTIVIGAALLVPWVRLPAWCQATIASTRNTCGLRFPLFQVAILIRGAAGTRRYMEKDGAEA